MPGILLLAQDFSDGRAVPCVGQFAVVVVLISADTPHTEVVRRAFDFFFREFACDDMDAQTIHRHFIDPLDDKRGVFINEPLVLVVRVFAEAIRGLTGNRLSTLTFRQVNGLYFLRCVPCIPFRHDFTERGEFIVAVGGIGAVVDTD
jgi:hypothetical protein